MKKVLLPQGQVYSKRKHLISDSSDFEQPCLTIDAYKSTHEVVSLTKII